MLLLVIGNFIFLYVEIGSEKEPVCSPTPLPPDTIEQLRKDYPVNVHSAYNAGPSMKEVPFDEIIGEFDHVIIGRVIEVLPAVELDTSRLLEPEMDEMREKEERLGLRSTHVYPRYAVEVVQHVSGKPVNKTIELTHNAILNEPELKTGMNILVGMTEGRGVHQGTYFFTRFGTYYIVEGDYVLSAVDDAFSKQMNGQKVGCLVEKVTEIRSNKEDAMQHATQLRLPGVPPNYQKMLEETDLVVHTGLAEQVITTEEESMVLLRLKVHQVIAGNARLEDGYVTIYSLDRLSFWGEGQESYIFFLEHDKELGKDIYRIVGTIKGVLKFDKEGVIMTAELPLKSIDMKLSYQEEAFKGMNLEETIHKLKAEWRRKHLSNWVPWLP